MTSTSSSSSRLALAAALLAAGARADVLDVPADFPTLAAAFAAAQPGDEVVLAPGVHEETVELAQLSGVTLRGKGKATLSGGSGLGAALKLSECTDVTIEHLEVLAGGATGVRVEDSHGVRLSRLRVTGAQSTGIDLFLTTESVIERCTTEDTGDYGISAVSGGGILVSRCQTSGTDGAGIALSLIVKGLVDRCRVIDGGVQGISLGTDLGGQQCEARRCVVLGIADAGLQGLGTDILFRDNRVQVEGGTGIVLSEGTVGALVQGNRVTGGGVGITSQASSLVLRDNRVIAPGSDGVLFLDSGGLLDGNRVLHAFGEGFVVGDEVVGGALTGCKSLHAGGNGFRIDGTQLTLTGNAAVGAGAFGFAVTGTDNLFVGNSAHGNGQFSVETVTGNTFIDNDFQTQN